MMGMATGNPMYQNSPNIPNNPKTIFPQIVSKKSTSGFGSRRATILMEKKLRPSSPHPTLNDPVVSADTFSSVNDVEQFRAVLTELPV